MIAAALAAFLPTPYSLILPGRAVNLGNVISLEKHGAGQSDLYLTDVRFAPHVTALALIGGFLPGARIVWTNDVLPRGITVAQYDGAQREAMAESQIIAAAVAERKAGYSVPAPRSRLMILEFVAHAPAAQSLRALDIIISLDGKPVSVEGDLRAILRSKRAGQSVRVGFVRRGTAQVAVVRTIAFRKRTVLGAYLTTLYERPRLPIAVNYHLPNVAGSSGGLMFALDIYRSLEHQPLPSALRVAGTGTIAYDGTVGPIEGAAQKVIAARDAGASVFLVPSENYDEVKATPGIRVLPVATFDQAAVALTQLSRPN